MNSFNQKFTIHPVGQGLFYSGKITYRSDEKFRMVLDCGSNGTSTAAGQEEVDNYRDSDFTTIKILDLLVISHFDQDHVNHIGRLLAEGIKIKKLVMPFITFAERLFLVARHIDFNGGYNPDDDFYIRFTIDPIGALNDNLDGNSEIFLIDGEPNGPIPPDEENERKETADESNDNRFVFDFEASAKEPIQSTEIILSQPKGKLYKVDHTNKGAVKSGRFTFLMDFLFYRRKISNDDKSFYEKVKELFYKDFSIAANLASETQLEAVKKAIKDISSASRIKSIFIAAKKEFGLRSKKEELVIEDLNTTALCLLHKNLNGIIDLLGKTQGELQQYPYWLWLYDNSAINQVHKFNAEGIITTTENPLFFRAHYYWSQRKRENSFLFPNVLLTADCFLLTSTQVSEFLNHYKHYWSDFWLFQIPHHGSDKSSNQLLYSNIPIWSSNFINYGIGNKHSHPSASVIMDLVATGNSAKLIPVNEVTGLVFGLDL